MEVQSGQPYQQFQHGSNVPHRKDRFCEFLIAGGCVVVAFAIAGIVFIVKTPPPDRGLPPPTPYPIPNATNITSSSYLLKQHFCPSNETLRELFLQHAFKAPTANPKILNSIVWHQAAIIQNEISANCLQPTQDCSTDVDAFKEFCLNSNNYV